MRWDCDIVHRSDFYLIDTNYWLGLGADLCFNPLLRDYIQRVASMHLQHPVPETTPMLPSNMPGHRGARLPREAVTAPPQGVDVHTMSAFSTIAIDDSCGHCLLGCSPVRFGTFGASVDESRRSSSPRYGSFLTAAAARMTRFEWGVYGFSNGHFVSSISTSNLPFAVVLAADPYLQGRSLFKEFTSCSRILPGVKELYDHIRSSGVSSVLHGYMIHSHRLPPGDSTKNFWQIQASIVSELR